MIICDYCGKDCYPDHSEYQLEEYRWIYSGYSSTREIFHLHKGCRDEVINIIRTRRSSHNSKNVSDSFTNKDKC